MIHHWKALDLEVTDCEYHHDLTSSCVFIPSEASNLKHVEIIKLLVEPTDDISL